MGWYRLALKEGLVPGAIAEKMELPVGPVEAAAAQEIRIAELKRDSAKGRERLEQHRWRKRQGEGAREDSGDKRPSGEMSRGEPRRTVGSRAEPRTEVEVWKPTEESGNWRVKNQLEEDTGGAKACKLKRVRLADDEVKTPKRPRRLIFEELESQVALDVRVLVDSPMLRAWVEWSKELKAE